MARFQVVCTDDQLKKWKGHAEEDPEFQNFSDFVRTSIVREIDRDEDESSAGGGATGEVNADLGDIPDSIDRIFNEFEEVHDRLDRIDAMADIKQPESEDLVRRIESNIPMLPKQAIKGWIDNQMDGTELVSEHPEGGKSIASATRLANHLDEDEYEVRQAAYELEHKNEGDILTQRKHGETFVFRVKQ